MPQEKTLPTTPVHIRLEQHMKPRRSQYMMTMPKVIMGDTPILQNMIMYRKKLVGGSSYIHCPKPLDQNNSKVITRVYFCSLIQALLGTFFLAVNVLLNFI